MGRQSVLIGCLFCLIRQRNWRRQVPQRRRGAYEKNQSYTSHSGGCCEFASGVHDARRQNFRPFPEDSSEHERERQSLHAQRERRLGEEHRLVAVLKGRVRDKLRHAQGTRSGSRHFRFEFRGRKPGSGGPGLHAGRPASDD